MDHISNGGICEKVKIKILRGWDEQELTATILERPAIKFLR